MRGIRKEFPGVLALDGVDFTLRSGEIHALMGENGAGKSTLIKALTGVYPPDAGSILLAGKNVSPKSPLEAQRFGISTVYQEVNLIPTLSVAENIFLGQLPVRGGRVDWRRMQTEAQAALSRLEVSVDPSETLGSCSIAVQQLVAIARALTATGSSKTLVLDEPTSSLDRDEVGRLFGVLRRLKANGLGIVFVSHFLDQVYEISDRITVLRNGRLVGEFATSELPRIQLVEAMLGRSAGEIESQERRAHEKSAGKVALAADGIGRRGVGPVSLEVKEGEVVGLAGLLGSGRTETARLLFGLDRPETGTLAVAGEGGLVGSPRAGMRKKIGFVPEDRKVEGLILSLSVRENILLAMQVHAGWHRRIAKRRQIEVADRYIKALRIATPSMETPVGRLSGGNQQKVVLARWLAAQPKVLILDEPTRGVDVGAKAEIENLMAELCGEGLAIILIGTDLEEVARDANRVVVMRDRKKVGELSGEEIEISRIMQMIASGAHG
jgi:monosaccharide-transporting ATPase